MKKIKKYLSIFLAVLFSVIQFVPAFAYDRTDSIEYAEERAERCDDFYAQSYNNYVVENGFVFDIDTQTIIQFNKSNYIENMIESVLDNTFPNPVTYTELDVMSTVIIPETISGHTVRFIGNYSFANTGLTQIVIPSCVEKIGDRAFEGNPLTNVCLSEGLLEIGRCAFSKGSIVIPKSVKYVDVHPDTVSFTFKNAGTKYNEYGYGTGITPLVKDDIIVDENAVLPVETYRDENVKYSTTFLWCHYIENDGFTYAYPLSVSWACGLCGENISRLQNSICPYCQETITEEDGTWIKEISNEDYYALYKETHEGMELRDYLIHKLIEANLIVDAKTALATDDEINTYLEENLVPYHFYWEDGELTSSYYRWIVSYDASLDETPEEITIDDDSARISDFHILDNLDKVETLNLSISSLIDWMDYHSLTTASRDSDSTNITTEDLMWIGMGLLSDAGSYKIFNGCSNIKNVNFCENADYSECTDEEMISMKAYAYDFVSLMLKFGFSFDISNVNFTFPDIYDIECINNVIYGDNQKLVIAALRNMNAYEMPSTVTDVCTFAFSQLTIDNFIWGENCLEVPFGCFSKSTIGKIYLRNIVLLEDFAFYKTNIDVIELPETVTTLGSCVFLGTPIKNMVLPESVKTMGSAVFANCLELKSIVLNADVTMGLYYYPFFLRQSNKVAGGDLTKIPHLLAIMSFSLYADYGPYDESIFGFVPNLEELYIGKNIEGVSIDSLGYLPSLTTIIIDESNEHLTTYNNFVITKEDSYGEFEVLFAPQGANFTDIPTNFPLDLFATEYFKPINSVIASTSHFDLYNIDINHLYITGVEINDILSGVYMSSGFNVEEKNLLMGLFTTVPNYLHTNKTGFINIALENINIPETLTIVREDKEIDINTDNGAELDVSLRNVSGKLYKIPQWTELTKNDFKYIGESDKYWKFAWYLGSDEFVSVNVDLLNEYIFSHTPIPMSSGYYDGYQASQYNWSDSTLKALRFVGDLDLLYKPSNEDYKFIEQFCFIFGLTNLYNLELTPNTVKSLFPDDLEMQSIIDKYTWDDGYLHFTSGGRFPVLQTDNPTQENIINDFINEFFIPWYNSTYGKMEGYDDVKSLLAISEFSFLKVADMNGMEYDLELSALVDEMYFDMLVQSEYEIAQANLSDRLTANNITTYAEFKQYYIDNYITFDEETQTLLNISSVTGMTPTNLCFPAKINEVEVKKVSVMLPLAIMALGSDVESMYIPSTIEEFGCITENIDQVFGDFYLNVMMIQSGTTSVEELDALLLEDSGMEFSAVAFDVSNDANIKNGFGILCDPDNISISSANEHFKKRTNAVGNTEIVSADGKTCYAVGKGSTSEVYLSGLSTTYAPYALGNYDNNSSTTYYYDVMGVESDFQSCSLSLIMAVDGLMCPDCGVILNKTRTSCPVCFSTELTVMQMDMSTMEYNYGATWRQEVSDGTAYTKRTSNIIAYDENSSFLTHCIEEHDGQACCSYVDPSTLTGYKLTNYEMTVEAYNNPSSEEITAESKGLYSITTDSDDIVTYSDEEFFETQFFVIENQPEQYLDAGIIVVEPFQESETVTLELKKGTVNAKSIDIDTGELITADFEYGIYSKDDSLVATVTAVNGLATFPDIAYGEYYMKQLNTPLYENLNKTVEFSITEDGQIVDVEFNNYIQTTYTVVIPEYIESVPAGEDLITQSVVATDVVLRPGHTLNITCEYSGELTLREDNDVKLGYKMKNNNDSFVSGDVILSCSSGDSTIIYDTSIGSILTASPNYAGVYTDTVTFTCSVT